MRIFSVFFIYLFIFTGFKAKTTKSMYINYDTFSNNVWEKNVRYQVNVNLKFLCKSTHCQLDTHLVYRDYNDVFGTVCSAIENAEAGRL